MKRLFLAVIAVITAIVLAVPAYAAESACPVGAPRDLALDFGERLSVPPVLIGCLRAPHLGRREVIAYRERIPRAGNLLCVDIVFADGSSGNCRPPNQRVHGADLSGGGTPDGALMFHGFASRWAARISLRYWAHGRLKRQTAAVVRVTDLGVLDRLGTSQPIAYYAVAATDQGRDALLLARNKRRKLIWWRSIGHLADVFSGGSMLGELKLPS